jgi:hypothetical protein
MEKLANVIAKYEDVTKDALLSYQRQHHYRLSTREINYCLNNVIDAFKKANAKEKLVDKQFEVKEMIENTISLAMEYYRKQKC